ncbi:MAG: hypothetical protein WAM14_19990 [Candidatus Nitrosopolaris sp.]
MERFKGEVREKTMRGLKVTRYTIITYDHMRDYVVILQQSGNVGIRIE